MFNVFLKKFFGPKYEMLFVAILTAACMILFSTDVEYNMTLDVFLLSNMLLSFILTFQTLTSKDNAQSFKRLFTYPLNPIEFKIKYTISIIFYSLVTRNAVLFSLYCGFSGFSIEKLILFLISTISTTILCIAIFTIFRTNKLYGLICIIIEFVFYVVCIDLTILTLSYFVNFIISIVVIIKSDIYVFKYDKNITEKNISSKNTSFFIYIIRYFLFNKTYLLSYIGIIFITYSLTFMNENLIQRNFLPLAFIMLCYNTPLATIISINKPLQKKIKSFPASIFMVYVPYFIVVFIMNLISTFIFILLIKYNTDIIIRVIQILFCFENALITVLLEYFLPIKKWNTETELWNNPRKYINPLLLCIQAIFLFNFL